MTHASDSLPLRATGPRAWLGLAFWIVLAFSASFSGAFFSPGEWYAGLNKPSFNPPGWVFGPVWTVLYAMMGVSAWLIWRHQGLRGTALKFWLLQLVLNATWTPVFFVAHEMGWALGIIMAMWLAILVTIVVAWSPSRAAALLLVPYLCWVSFATLLNATLWKLN